MTPQQVLPVLIPMLVVGLIVLKSRGAPRTLRPQPCVEGGDPTERAHRTARDARRTLRGERHPPV